MARTKKKPCANCILVEAGEDEAHVTLSGHCPECKKELPIVVLADDEDDDEPSAVPLVDAEPGDDDREGKVRSIYAILGAYTVSMRVGSAAAWIQAREVLAAAQRLVDAEVGRAPDAEVQG